MDHIWYNKEEQIAKRYLEYLRIITIDKVFKVYD